MRNIYGNGVTVTRAGVRNYSVSAGTMAGSGCALEPAPFPSSMSSVLGKVIPGGKICVSIVDGNLAVAVLSPGRVGVPGDNRNIVVDIDHFHAPHDHVHLSVLKATAQQHKIRLIGEVAPCFGCSETKEIRAAATPNHTTARVRAPIEVIPIDTAGPYPELLRDSRYVIMFVDTAPRLQGPCGTRDKSSPAILTVLKHFVVNMGVSRAFRTDNSLGYTNRIFVEYCLSPQ